MNLGEIINKLLELEDELFENNEDSSQVTVVLPQCGEEIEDWDADISVIEMVVVDGKKVLRIY